MNKELLYSFCCYITINGLNVVQSTFYTEDFDSSNNKWIVYYLKYTFIMDNVLVEITINSQKDNLAQYHSAMQKVIQSFKLKEKRF